MPLHITLHRNHTTIIACDGITLCLSGCCNCLKLQFTLKVLHCIASQVMSNRGTTTLCAAGSWQCEGTKMQYMRPPPVGCDTTLYENDNWYKMGGETATAWAESITTGACSVLCAVYVVCTRSETATASITNGIATIVVCAV